MVPIVRQSEAARIHARHRDRRLGAGRERAQGADGEEDREYSGGARAGPAISGGAARALLHRFHLKASSRQNGSPSLFRRACISMAFEAACPALQLFKKT